MNHISDIAQLLTALGLLLNAIGTVMSYFRSKRNGELLKDVKEQTDGISSRLVIKTGEAEHAKGMLQGAKEQREKDA